MLFLFFGNKTDEAGTGGCVVPIQIVNRMYTHAWFIAKCKFGNNFSKREGLREMEKR